MTSNKLLLAVGAAIITSLVIISLIQQDHTQTTFSKIITVGPVWQTNTWSCYSDQDFLVYGALRGLQGSMLSISISNLGTQSLYSFIPEQMQTFSVGATAGHVMNITRTGTVTGWITLQTMSGAKANCTQT
ncbi:MAG TPA: hypothetical protein VFG24_05410 [Nitrosopumilaceae archaeon]|nr:hypothetical protein [Nitrosopumilaceae archaeon]